MTQRTPRDRLGSAHWRCAGPLPPPPSSPPRRRSSSTTPRSTTTSSPPSRRRRRCSTRAPSSRAGRAPASTFNAWRTAADDPAAVAVCRFFGTPGVGPNSHFYTADAAECATVKTNPNWTYEAIAFYIEVPQGGRCAAGTEAVYRSFYPGAAVSQSNHRFLPDLTMHQKMAATSTLEGVVMCAPLSTAQKQADAVRLLEQATFGPTDALVAHVRAVGADAFLDEQFAASGSRYSSNKYVPAGGAADVLPHRSRSELRPRLLHAVPAAERVLPQRARRRRPAAPARRVRAVADLRHLGPRHQRGLRHGDLPADLPRQRVRQLRDAADQGDALAGDGRLPQHGQQRQAGRTGTNPNENYARELLQLFSIGVWELNPDGTLLTRRARAADPDLRPGHDRGLRARLHRLDVSAAARARRSARTTRRTSWATWRPWRRNHDTGAKALLDGAVAPAGPRRWTPTSPTRSTTSSSIPNVGPFIGKQLIQKLVTGNPSPQYVARVAAVFNNNGAGRARRHEGGRARDPARSRGARRRQARPRLRQAARAGAVRRRARRARVEREVGRRVLRPAGVGARPEPLLSRRRCSTTTRPTTWCRARPLLGPEFALAELEHVHQPRQRRQHARVRHDRAARDLSGRDRHAARLVARSRRSPATPTALVDKLDALLLHGTMPAAMRSGARRRAINAVPRPTR